MHLSIDDLKACRCIIFEAISGSRAYGLATPESDTDIKGVFILPEDLYFGFQYIDQVNDEGNNIVYYELRKFMQLLAKNNPNIMELLKIPEDCILMETAYFKKIISYHYLSKLCHQTFANYAMAQMKKARGLNKKIVNPFDKQRKSVLDFCYVLHDGKSLALKDYLTKNQLDQLNCGLVNINHMKEVYALYYAEDAGYRGITRKDGANDVMLSSVDKDKQPLTYLSFNKDGYIAYCKGYKDYWDWVQQRNQPRYQSTISHGKNYDAKNMMHTFRLLNMAEEIASTGNINVRRADRSFLLKIKQGEYAYEQLLTMANQKIEHISQLFSDSDLPETPDSDAIEKLLITIRADFYQTSINVT